MPWNQTAREQYKREAVRYESDLTDAEWATIASLFPSPNRRGRPRKTDQGRVYRPNEAALVGLCGPLPGWVGVVVPGVSNLEPPYHETYFPPSFR